MLVWNHDHHIHFSCRNKLIYSFNGFFIAYGLESMIHTDKRVLNRQLQELKDQIAALRSRLP